ncbi:triose-phosphate transporter family-domain-containing protein [Phlyctochytrium arcticum]|nr:triose-phosphate transporter family-domain-containing protein [Phlyctochytrium arcticum]
MRSSLAIKIVLWYACTIGATIAAKKFLSLSSDPYTLSLLSFAFGAVASLFQKKSSAPLPGQSTIYKLAVLHLATTLLTNISLGKASVAFTYMIKATEPVFAAVLSRIFLGESGHPLTYLALIPIIVGVAFTAGGERASSQVSLLSALASNLAASSRNVFFKSSIKETPEQCVETYFAVCRHAMIIFSPVYAVGVVAAYWGNSASYITQDSDFLSAMFFLACGSALHFAYSLLSFVVLEELSPISHAITNVMKRVVIILASLIYFDTPLRESQVFGLVLANAGVASYTYTKSTFRRTSAPKTRNLANLEWKKKICINIVTVLGILTMILDSGVLSSESRHNGVAISHITRDWDRRVCLKKIQEQILSTMRPLLPRHERYVFLDFAIYTNLGDNFLSLGEQHLIHALDLNVKEVCTISTKERSCSFERVSTHAQNGMTLLYSAGGNFGTLWPTLHSYRMKVFSQFRQSRMISLPQSVFYSKEPTEDALKMAQCSNLTLTWRSHDSMEYSQKHFPSTPTALVPDMAFMLGDVPPETAPSVDVIFLVRGDHERLFKPTEWREAERELLDAGFTTEHTDWSLSKDQSEYPGFDVGDILLNRLHIANRLLSRGKVIITDRLHASILAVLMGKPHIYLDNSYKKITEVRRAAFEDKEECSDTVLQGSFADSPSKAAERAIGLLQHL